MLSSPATPKGVAKKIVAGLRGDSGETTPARAKKQKPEPTEKKTIISAKTLKKAKQADAQEVSFSHDEGEEIFA